MTNAVYDQKTSDLDNFWWTHKARIQAEKRLLFYNFWSTNLLLWYSLINVFVSIYLLSSSSRELDSTVVSLSIFILVLSLHISSSKFPDRAHELKTNYEKIQRLYFKCKTQDEIKPEDYDQYKLLLEASENHKSIDFSRAVISAYFSTKEEYRSQLTNKPQRITYFSVAIAVIGRVLAIALALAAPLIWLTILSCKLI